MLEITPKKNAKRLDKTNCIIGLFKKAVDKHLLNTRKTSKSITPNTVLSGHWHDKMSEFRLPNLRYNHCVLFCFRLLQLYFWVSGSAAVTALMVIFWMKKKTCTVWRQMNPVWPLIDS